MKAVSENVQSALADMDDPLKALAENWAASPYRPKPTAEVLQSWDALLEEWLSSPLPLLCRTPNWGRGARDLHSSGRILTCADNTPAHWAFARALAGETPTLSELETLFSNGEMPLAFAIKISEKARLEYARGGLSSKLRLNRDGWKVCHAANAGLRLSGHPTTQPMSALEAHFRRFMSPAEYVRDPSSDRRAR